MERFTDAAKRLYAFATTNAWAKLALFVVVCVLLTIGFVLAARGA